MKFWSKLHRASALTAMLASAAACGTAEETPAEDPNAAFNYVPLNVNVCKTKDDNASRHKVARALSGLARMDTVVADQLKLCTDCPDNKFGFMLKETKATINIGGRKLSGNLEARVNSALAYPFRHLMISAGIKAGNTNIVLSQAMKVGPAKGALYQVQAESLAADCANYDLATVGKRTDLAGDCGDSFKTSVPLSKPFGFKVPNALPPAGATQAQAAALLERTSALGVRIEKAHIEYTVNDKGEGEGMLRGLIDPGSLKPFIAAKVNLAKYSEGTPPRIPVVLQFKTKRARITPALSPLVAKMTNVYTGTTKKPPAISTGSVTWDGGSCTNCKELGKQSICAEDQTAEVPLPAVHIQGDSGSFKLKFDAKDTKPVIEGSALEAGGTIAADGDANLNEVQYTFTRGYRPGTSMTVKPACVDVMTGKSPVPTTFDPKDGWIRTSFRPTDGVEVGCQRSIVICQEFDDTSCGANGKLNADGSCGCQDGFQHAFDSCVKPADFGCDAAAMLSKDAAGTVQCACPANMSGDGKTCTLDPCKDNGTCKEGEHCIVQEDHTAGCEPESADTLAEPAKRGNEVAASFDASAPKPPAAPGYGEKAGAAEADDDDDDDDGDTGDDDDDAASKPPGAPGVDFISNFAQVANRTFTMASDLMLYPKKGKLRLPEDLERKAGKKMFTAGAIVTKAVQRPNKSSLYNMYISAANWAKVSAAVKAKNLTPTLRIGLQKWGWNVREAEWFPAKQQAPRVEQIAKYYVAPCPDVVNLTNNKTELVYQMSIETKAPPAPKMTKAQRLATLRALAKARMQFAKR